jgi:predicted esterase
VLGFSQGAAAAAMVASLLEDRRAAAFGADGGEQCPASFVGSLPLRFAVCYSGFCAPRPRYRAFYEPPIATPVLHFIGSLDGVVEEGRSLELVRACENPRVVYHPGGHFVPIGKDMVGQLVAFIREACIEKSPEADDGVEDMDVPF